MKRGVFRRKKTYKRRSILTVLTRRGHEVWDADFGDPLYNDRV